MVLATVVDITARRRAELELTRHAADLELANERLAQFAYVASHDLQEPLRKIAAYAGLIEEAVRKSDQITLARATAVVSASAVRARRMVENLLAFSRVGAAETRTERLDLGDEIAGVLADLSVAIEEAGAAVEVAVEPVVVPADRAQLGRLIQNIVANAIKFRKCDTSPLIVLRTERVGRDRIQLSIADDGIGFDETFAAQIFEPFKRLHTPNAYDGSGIGLAICKSIADRYGWTLTAHSRPGEGSTFTLTLPIVE